MARTKKDQRQANKERAWELRVQRGWSITRIGEEMGFHFTTINNWLNEIREAGQDRLKRESALQLIDQFDRLEAAIEQAWRGWERSQEDAVTVKESETVDGTFITKTAKGQSGDPRFLAEIRSLLQQQRELLGLSLKYDVEEDKGGKDGKPIDPNDLRREVERNRILRARRGGAGDLAGGDEG